MESRRPKIKRQSARLKSSGELRQYHYAWRGGPLFWKNDGKIAEGSRAYWQAYETCFQEAKPDHGTFRAVVREFQSSPRYKRLSERTQRNYLESLNRKDGIDAKWGDAPVALFNDPRIRQQVYRWRDNKFQSDRVADMVAGHLNTICAWAYDRGILTANHLAGMEHRYKSDRSGIYWTEPEIDAYLTGRVGEVQLAPPARDFEARPMILATETGLRPADLIRVGRNHLHSLGNQRVVQIMAQKTRNTKQLVTIPVMPRLARLIDTTPRDQIVFLTGGTGLPYGSSYSLNQVKVRRRNTINAEAKRLGLEPPIRRVLTFYDTRSSAVYRLLESGATIKELSSAMGWSVDTAARMADVYATTRPSSVLDLFAKLDRNG